MSSSQHVGVRIRSERERKGLSRRTLAEMIGVSTEGIRLIETELRMPSSDLLSRLVEALDVSLEDLLPPEELATLRSYKRNDPSIVNDERLYILIDGELIEVLSFRRLGPVHRGILEGTGRSPLVQKPFDFVFATKDDAENVLDAMKEVIKTYGHVSVSDFKDLAGIPHKLTYRDSRTGWTNLDEVNVSIKYPDGYILHLPIPSPW